MKNALVITLATVLSLATISIRCPGQERTNKLGNEDNGLVDHSEQSLNAGWVPEIRKWETTTNADESCPVKLNTETEEQKSLRWAYNGRVDRRPTLPANPYNLFSQEGVQTPSTFFGQDEETEKLDFTPEHIKNKGDEKMNYAVVISADWCVWCKRMYPMLLELRKEGYIIYIFETNRPEFEDFAALYNVRAYPTTIIYDNAEEVKRHIGKVEKEWLEKNLKTRKEQKAEPVKPDTNPYDKL